MNRLIPEYEKIVVANSEMIFGNQGIYFDIKKKIEKSKEGAAIPDGYYLDLKFHDEPILYFVDAAVYWVFEINGDYFIEFNMYSPVEGLLEYESNTYILNTNYSNNEQHSKDMLKEQKAARE